MKILLLCLSLATIVSQSFAIPAVDGLECSIKDAEIAIRASSMIFLKAAIKKFDNHELLSAERKKSYRDFSYLATAIREQQEEKLSIEGGLGHPEDCVNTVLGLLCATWAIIFPLYNYFEPVEPGADFMNLCRYHWIRVTFLSSIVASYFLHKGLTCGAQKTEIAKAKAIEKFLHEKADGS